MSPASAAPWAIVACLLWGSAFAVVKIGLDANYLQPFTFAGVRFILAGMLLLPLAGRPRRTLAAVRTHWRLVVVISFLQTVMLYGTFFWGLSLIEGAQGAILLGSSPLITAVLAHLMLRNDKMTFAMVLPIALGMTGIAILALASKPWEPAGLTELGGMGLILAGVIAGSLANVVYSKARAPINPLAINSAQMGLGGVVLLVLGLVVEGRPTELPPVRFLWILLYLSALSATAFSIWFFLIARVKVSRLNMWKFLIPVFGAAFSWLLLPGESPDTQKVIAMVCVAAAILLAHWQSVRANRAPIAAEAMVEGADDS